MTKPITQHRHREAQDHGLGATLRSVDTRGPGKDLGVDIRITTRTPGRAVVMVAPADADWLAIALDGSSNSNWGGPLLDLRLAPVTARLLADLLERAADLADGYPRSRHMRRHRMTTSDIRRRAMDIDQLAAPLIASDNHDNRQEE